MQARNVLRASVLLVDDQPADLALMERHLGPFDLNLVKAQSGEEALEYFQGREFALVLMDVRLPGLSGIETARLMYREPLAKPLPLIFLTGENAEKAAIAHGYATGGVDWLEKPVDPEVLRAKVRVFVELYQAREALRQHQEALRDRERELMDTQRLRAEQERERLVVELRGAVRQRDEFLAVASHELKTPLTPLALRLQLVRRELGRHEVDVPRLLGHVEEATGQVRRLTALVDSLLDVTLISQGQLALRREQDVDFVAVVREVLVRFEAQALRAHCALELEAPGRVMGEWDVLRLEQIITHLLSNALKFGAGTPVHVRLEEHEGLARLTVRDEGIGMDEALSARIFGRFERGVSERHYGGLGLGLFITRQVTEAMEGQIRVESAPGEGSTFTVELPCAPGETLPGGTRHEA